MTTRITILTVLFFFCISLFCHSQTIIVSQVDNSSLLLDQKIRVYVSVTDKNGNPVTNLTQEKFELLEALPEKKPEKREIIFFKHGANVNEGINLMFIVDNSGSMYNNMYGRETRNENEWRITYAKQAINDLLRKIKNPQDRLSLVSFNIKVDSEIPPTGDITNIAKALTEIKKPEEGKGYTELYESLYYSIETLSSMKGRKVIVLLSDGENYPKKDNPNFQVRKGLKGALDLAQREGITVFTIGLIEGANNPDLQKIADESGGVNYRVSDVKKLSELYNDIRDRVLHEYLIIYNAGMEPAEKKYVTVKLLQGAASVSAERAYYSATLFGMPQTGFMFWMFFFIPLAVLLLWLVSKIRFESRQVSPALEVLTVDGKKKKMHPLTIMENQNAVTIGGTESADLTIMGEPKLQSNDVIVQKKKDVYTVVSMDTPIAVNNQLVKSKVLRSGDLIKVGNTTIVFNGGIDKTLLTPTPAAKKAKEKTKTKEQNKTSIMQAKKIGKKR
jgi:Ca-activated chloride channel family protein